jgi:hypothetical protein
LLKVLAGIVGKQDVATLADHDHALAGPGHAGQWALGGQGAGPGGLIEDVDVSGCVGRALQQAQQNTEGQLHNIIFIRTHTASSSKPLRGTLTFKPRAPIFVGASLLAKTVKDDAVFLV